MFNLCTYSQIEDSHKGTLDPTFSALFSNQIIPSVTLRIASYCGRLDFDQKARSVLFSPRLNRERLFLNSPPIATSPAIQVWQSGAVPRVYGADELLTLGEDYWTEDDEGILVKNGYWLRGPQAVKVTYTGGYLTDHGKAASGLNIEDLIRAAVTQAKLDFDRRESPSVSSESLGGGSFSYSAGLKLDPSVREIADKYRVWSDGG